MTRRQAAIYPSLAAIVALLFGMFPPSIEAATTLTFVPIADAQVASGNPTGNYGSLATIRTREASGTPTDPTYRSFLTFDVSGVGGQSITSVTLRLYATDESPSGQGVHRVPDPAWSESAITFANPPAFDASALATAPVPILGAYNDLPLPASAVSGDGRVSFALKSAGNNSAIFSSREASANRPQLVVVTGGPGPTPTPTPTPTATPTPTPTPTAGPTPTPTPTAGPTPTPTPTAGPTPTPSPTPTPTPTPTPSPTPTPTGPPTSLTITPAADAQVHSRSPSTNYGSLSSLRTREDTNPSNSTYRFYLRFDVNGLSGPVQSVRLRVYVTDSTKSAQGVYAIANTTWTESGITYQNAPAIGGSPLATVTPGTTNAYVDIDLPASAVPSNGRYAFALKSTGTDSLIVASREVAASRPQLVINGGSPPPPSTPVGAFSSSPSSGNAPLTVAFTDQSTNGPTAWSWDFDDPGSGSQNTSTLRNPSHTFASAGSYDVRLTPSNGAGTGTPVTHTISVTTPGGSGDPVFVGAGDIANCSRTQDESTAQLLDGIAGTVFTAGDNVYENGTATEFANCYGPTWGRHKARTRPVAGNHEYQTSGASGYYGYFGSAAGDPSKGYYSFDIGAWHAVVLNSNCSQVGGCGASSPQATWLRNDLAAHPASCTVAIWHHPRFSSSRSSPDGLTAALWQALYDAGAELIIGGHYHNYERFDLQTPAGSRDTAFGIREFVVGTGGAALVGFSGGVMANSLVRNNSTYGVLKLTLHSTSYDFTFVPIAGQSFSESGSGTCHATPSASLQAGAAAATDRQLREWSLDVAERTRRGRPSDVLPADLRDAATGVRPSD